MASRAENRQALVTLLSTNTTLQEVYDHEVKDFGRVSPVAMVYSDGTQTVHRVDGYNHAFIISLWWRRSADGGDTETYIDDLSDDIQRLFNIHSGLGFDGNLIRLVEATTNISPSGRKFEPTNSQFQQILLSPERAIRFVKSQDAQTLKEELDAKVEKFKNEILLAALIENVNVRGRIIEYLIAGEDDRLLQEIINALQKRTNGIPQFKTENSLGDYTKEFKEFFTETDVKTKIMILDSNPKAYNLDKMLEFLASERSVFMFYFVGVEPGKLVNTVLVSMFQDRLLNSTILLKHWAGRNSRGVSQFEGKSVGQLILSPETAINEENAIRFLRHILAL